MGGNTCARARTRNKVCGGPSGGPLRLTSCCLCAWSRRRRLQNKNRVEPRQFDLFLSLCSQNVLFECPALYLLKLLPFGNRHTMPGPLSELRSNVSLQAQRKTPTPSKRRLGKGDLAELLSTARLADLRSELRALSPPGSGPPVSTPAVQVVRPALARGSAVHSAAAASAVLSAASNRPGPAGGAAATPSIGQTNLFGGHSLPAARQPPPEVHKIEVSPTTMMQMEINRKRDMLFNLGVHANVLQKNRTIRRSSIAKGLSSAASRRVKSRPISRRESFANEGRRRSQELDRGESAGALKFRELRTQLQGHTHLKMEITPIASPAPLWTHPDTQRSSAGCVGREAIVKDGWDAKAGGVVMSVAPNCARTPEFFETAAEDYRQRQLPLPTQTCLPQTPQHDPSQHGPSPFSPLTAFISLFEATQAREISRLALRVWRSKANAACRHMQSTRQGTSADQSTECGSCSRTVEVPVEHWVNSDAARNDGRTWNVVWIREFARLLVRTALQHWQGAVCMKRMKRSAVTRFIGRQLRRSLFVWFRRWCVAVEN